MADGQVLSYLIVTRPIFLEALIPFVNWKSGVGYRVGVVTVEWLAQRFPARHLAESMKTGMHTLRLRTGVQYVLLVGDTEIESGNFDISAVQASYSLTSPWNVPTGFNRYKNDPPGEVLPGDAYFVEDRDWDPDNTGLNVVPGQDENGLGYLDATLYLGRWSVRTPEEIGPIFAKTQRFSPTNKIFFTRMDEGYIFPLEEVLRSCPELPFPEWYCYEYEYARQRLYEQNAPWLVTESLVVDVNDAQQGSHLKERLSGFDGVILESYHGSYTFIEMPNSEVLASHDYRMLVTISCYVAAFYSGSTDTFAESILKGSSGPAIVAQPLNDYLFLKNLRDGQSVGQAFWRSENLLYTIGGVALLLGDPSLQVMPHPSGNQ